MEIFSNLLLKLEFLLSYYFTYIFGAEKRAKSFIKFQFI